MQDTTHRRRRITKPLLSLIRNATHHSSHTVFMRIAKESTSRTVTFPNPTPHKHHTTFTRNATQLGVALCLYATLYHKESIRNATYNPVALSSCATRHAQPSQRVHSQCNTGQRRTLFMPTATLHIHHMKFLRSPIQHIRLALFKRNETQDRRRTVFIPRAVLFYCRTCGQ